MFAASSGGYGTSARYNTKEGSGKDEPMDLSRSNGRADMEERFRGRSGSIHRIRKKKSLDGTEDPRDAEFFTSSIEAERMVAEELASEFTVLVTPGPYCCKTLKKNDRKTFRISIDIEQPEIALAKAATKLRRLLERSQEANCVTDSARETYMLDKEAKEAEIAASDRPRWAKIIDKLSLTKWKALKQHHTDGDNVYSLTNKNDLAKLRTDVFTQLPQGYITLQVDLMTYPVYGSSSKSKKQDESIRRRRSSITELQGRAKAKCQSHYDQCSSMFDAPFDIKYHHADDISDCLPWYRSSSWINKLLECISLFIILASVVTLCIESLPQYRLNQTDGSKLSTKGTPLFVAETCWTAFFTLEFLWRLTVAVEKMPFLKNPMNIVDIVAILPYYISLALADSNVKALMAFRVLRLLKVSRYSPGFQMIASCMYASRNELGLFVIMVFVGTILFASAIYYCEKNEQETDFQSIPASFWWALATMTTVGYGDMVPTTGIGWFFGSLSASLGVVSIAIPASLFISEFLRLRTERIYIERGDRSSRDKTPRQTMVLALEYAKEELKALKAEDEALMSVHQVVLSNGMPMIDADSDVEEFQVGY